MTKEEIAAEIRNRLAKNDYATHEGFAADVEWLELNN